MRLKFITNWIGDDHFKLYLSKMTKNNFKWDDIELVTENEDFTVVINFPNNEDKRSLDPKKTIYISMEPESSRCGWGKWYKPDRSSCIYREHRNGLEWHISMTYNQLIEHIPIKRKLISSIVSDYYHLEGHKLRLDFINNYLSNIEGFDHYGKGNHKNKSFRGFLSKKEDGLFDYKYHFNAENTLEDNYFTEKFADAILSECLLFYWGCPNIESWINPNCFIRLDLHNPKKAINTVLEVIESNEWEKRIDIIREEKTKILNTLQIIPTVKNILLKI